MKYLAGSLFVGGLVPGESQGINYHKKATLSATLDDLRLQHAKIDIAGTSLMNDFPAAYHSISTYRDFDLNKYLQGDYAAVGANNVLERLSKAMMADGNDRIEIKNALALPTDLLVISGNA